MITKFCKFIKNECLFSETDHVLVAASGGIDSMCLLHLLNLSHIPHSVCHVNYQLRGEASDQDEAFLEEYCSKNNLDFFVKKVNLKKILKANNGNLQAEARDIRYEWMHKIATQKNIQFILTAHHQKDVLESFFLHLSRGSGVRGLKSIPLKSGKIVRPLLNFSKEEIKNWMHEQNFPYREDQSNHELKYDRNYIRHKIIPLLDEWKPHFSANALESISYLRDAHDIIENQKLLFETQVVQTEGDKILVDFKKAKNFEGWRTLLFLTLQQWGFSKYTTNSLLEAKTGSEFHSTNFKIIKNREQFVIVKNVSESNNLNIEIKTLPQQIEYLSTRVKLSVQHRESINDYDPELLYLDFDKMKFPLRIRNKENGDRFAPLGLQGQSQIVKKFLTNLKLDKIEKERQLVLLSDNRICCVIGRRIDDRYKISDDTKKVLVISQEQFLTK